MPGLCFLVPEVLTKGLLPAQISVHSFCDFFDNCCRKILKGRIYSDTTSLLLLVISCYMLLAQLGHLQLLKKVLS